VDVFSQVTTSSLLPLGWKHPWHSYEDYFRVAPKDAIFSALTILAGWVMTALAISFGAPFWFDLLNKFMVVRSTVKPHEKSPEEGSEDRQTRSERRASVVITPAIPGGAPPGGAPPGGAPVGAAAPAGAAAGGAPAPASAPGSRPAGVPPTDKELQTALPTRPAIRVNP